MDMGLCEAMKRPDPDAIVTIDDSSRSRDAPWHFPQSAWDCLEKRLLPELIERTPQNGKVRAAEKSMDLRAVLDQALANLKATMDETGTRVTLGPLPRVMGDETHR